jgi:hypothetical protein
MISTILNTALITTSAVGTGGIVIGVGILIGILFYCCKNSSSIKDNHSLERQKEYDNLIDNMEYLQKQTEEKQKLRDKKLLQDIFNDDSYYEIKELVINIDNKKEKIEIIASEYGKLIVELFFRELLCENEDQIGGGTKIVDEIIDNMDTPVKLEVQTNEI